MDTVLRTFRRGVVLAMVAGPVSGGSWAGFGPLFSGAVYGTGEGPDAVVAGDLNGDGWSDLAVGNTQSATVSVLLGSGAGLFAARVDYAIGGSTYAVAIEDLDGDGWADLATANFDSDTVSVLINRSCQPGDVDCDDDVDIADLALLLEAYRQCVGDPEYNPYADLDDSGCVDLFDLAELLSHYGEGT